MELASIKERIGCGNELGEGSGRFIGVQEVIVYEELGLLLVPMISWQHRDTKGSL